MEDKKLLKEARTIFSNLKTDLNSALFSEEKSTIDCWKNFKKSKYLKQSQLLKLILLADNKDFSDDDKTPTRTDYVKKREIDRSTLYSFDGPFQLLHADVGNSNFLAKERRQQSLNMFLWLLTYTRQKYVYPMRFSKQILQKMKLFYDKVKGKRKNKRMRLQVDNRRL